MKGKVIAIEGSIGAGKTTKVKLLCEYLNSQGCRARHYEEKINLSLLRLFIADMKRYAFVFQMSTLESRRNMQKEARDFAEEGGIAILDRSIIGDYTFASMHHQKGNISAEEMEVYLETYEEASAFGPDHVIFLDCRVDTLMRRIRTRNREGEINGYDQKYLEDLCESYEAALRRTKMIPVVRVPWDDDRDSEGILKFLSKLCL